jgi:hypothetical protein
MVSLSRVLWRKKLTMLILYRYIWLVYVYFGLSAPILPTITADNRESTVFRIPDDGQSPERQWFWVLHTIVRLHETHGLRKHWNKQEYVAKLIISDEEPVTININWQTLQQIIAETADEALGEAAGSEWYDDECREE